MATWGTEVIGCHKAVALMEKETINFLRERVGRFYFQKHVTQSKNVSETETKSSAQNDYKKLSTKQSM